MDLLDKQIQVLSVDTGNFYSNNEAQLHWKNHKLKIERKKLIDGYCDIGKNGRVTRKIVGRKELEKKIATFGIDEKTLNLIKSEKIDYDFSIHGDQAATVKDLCCQYVKTDKLIGLKNKNIKKTKEALLLLLENKVNINIETGGKHHIRALNENQVSTKNVISVFDSSFTRTIGAKPDTFSEDFMVVQVYYYSVIKDLIYHGFIYKGEKYIYFTSSAGQIRTKKCVFVKESVWNKHQGTIMCGLTLDVINQMGGNNPNKFLAYLALSNSATDEWLDFDIDKTIVVDDFETDVYGTYDLVDEEDYSVKRMSGYIPIPHTDGAGMMLPSLGKNCMIRMPWVKGLLGVFDFRRFIEVNNCSPVIKDIYGDEHDVISEDIQIIFTKSQFKLYKAYSSWQEYKDLFKKYHCTAGRTNVEEYRIKDATINYQMLQTLTDCSDDELLDIARESVERLNNISSSVSSMKAAFGITPYNTNKTAFQKAVDLYPDLLNDEYVKVQLREIKDSLIKKYKSGKLQVKGKYTFLLPDFYAACEFWFLGNKNPGGLLDDGEVFCWLFRKDEKVDCLRSPHLFVEHGIRNNVACCTYGERQQKIREWFCTDGVYTSCKDAISKILQFDVDGDKSLVVSDKTLISVAERIIKKFDIVPLYYNMKKASAIQLNNESIYNGLSAAFTGSNIGQYSNDISKIWNSEVFVSGDFKSQVEAVNVVKLLCCENNFCIDYAKTLYKPERPAFAQELISSFTKSKVPHFFKYAKDKENSQIADWNETLVNKLEQMIPNPRINCRGLGLRKPDYKLLMSNPNIFCRVSFTDRGRMIKDETDPLIVKYCELSKQYGMLLSDLSQSESDGVVSSLSQNKQKQYFVYKQAIQEIKTSLLQFGYSDVEVSDILVKFLYEIRDSKHKTILWLCYGDYLLENLERHIRNKSREVQCLDCGKWFDVTIKDNRTCRCEVCALEHKRNLTRLRVEKFRNKHL